MVDNRGTNFTIIIVDRNPNIRKLLVRELSPCGGRICPVKSIGELVHLLDRIQGFCVLIIDPDLPGEGKMSALTKIAGGHPDLAFIVHTHIADYASDHAFPRGAIIIEKARNSIEKLRKSVWELAHGPGEIKGG